MRLNKLLGAVTALCLLAAPLRAEDLRTFFYGNSLINHISDTEETSVPHWLALLAEAGGHGFAASGTFGDLTTFGSNLPPSPNWSFEAVTPAWDAERMAFRRAEFDTIILNPRNFVQSEAPDEPFPWNNPEGYTAVERTVRVFDWTAFQVPDARFFIYEGWSDMALVARNFPPSDRDLRRYHRFNRGDYHDWYTDYVDQVADQLPDLDLTLIPVASVLAGLFSDGPLDEIEATDLYLDESPHGTPTLYFLASLITYAAIYNEAPPMLEPFPEGLHPDIEASYPEIISLIWSRSQGAALDGALTPPPATGLTDPALAMGLNGIADWSTQMPFVDLMKSARPWVGHLDGQWGGVSADDLEMQGFLSPEGWPIEIPNNVTALESFILTDLPEEARDTVGRYRVTWEGDGRFLIGGRAEEVEIQDHVAWFSFRPGDGPVALRIEETNASNPIRNIVVLADDHIALWELGEAFNPDWVARIQDLRSLRFMDWMHTNGSLQIIWEDRPVMSDYTFVRRGVPVELLVRLSNQVGADPWFTLPHMADDRYFRNFAEYVEARLAPDLRSYVEYSNEVWNFLFPQAHWAAAQAAARWDGATGDAWMQYGGLRAAEMADIWAEVFQGQEDRLIRVIGTQASWPGLEEAALTAPLATEEGLPPPADSFDAYAVAGYFGVEMGMDDRVPEVLSWIEDGVFTENMTDALRSGSIEDLNENVFPYHADVAANYGLDMVMYEGGTHIVGIGDNVANEVLTAAFQSYSYSEDMAVLYAELLTGWRAAGGTLFNAFVDVNAPTPWGSWGALRHLSDSNPRWATLEAYNATAGGEWEERAETAFSHGLYVTGTGLADTLEGSAERDIFIARGGDDRLILGPGDRAHGGAGRDVAVLPGAASDYALVEEGAFRILNGPSAPIRLLAVEIAEFSDEPGALYSLNASEG